MSTLRTFPEIAPTSWEHPADRAALQTLRAIPAFDQLVKKVVGFFGERGIRMIFQGNAVCVGPRQFSRLHALQTEVHETFDWREEVPLFVSHRPWFNAGAYGVDRPFIVLHSAAVDLLSERELRALIGHELGHVMSGHVLYRTMLAIILAFGLRKLPFLTGVALLPLQLALLEWSRKSELSCDRAALLACQDVDDVIRKFLKAAGGTFTKQEMLDLDAYKEQIRQYGENDDLDAVFKVLNLLDQTHPFHTLRAATLLAWSESAEYRRILDGDYRRRSERQTAESYGKDFNEAASYYVSEAAAKAGEFSEIAKGIARQAGDFARQAAQGAKETVQDAAEKLNAAVERRK